MIKLAERMSRIAESATMKRVGAAPKSQHGESVIRLDIGEPDFPTPRIIVDEAIKHISTDTHYKPSLGIPPLREAISRKLKVENNISIPPDSIIVTPGAKQALMEAILALVDSGDEVLLPVPAWPSFKEMISFAGGVPVEVSYLKGVDDFLSALSKAVTPRTKLLIFNYPNNPTGYSYTEKDVRRIADFALSHKLFIISDEIYERIVYDMKHFSIASIPDATNSVLTIIGFSKSYAMTGWRLGYAAGPHEIIRAMNKIQQQSVTCIPGFIQMAAVEALQKAGADVQKMVHEFRRRRDFICKGLNENPVFFLEKIPEGAFYVFPKFSYRGMKSSTFEDFLYDELGVSVTAGGSFGGFDDRVRISYASSMDLIGEALERLKRIKAS